jgi:glutathione-regulated potassium-efflux system protein KefB
LRFHAGVKHPVRETFESAIPLGQKALQILGQTPERAAEIVAQARNTEAERFQLGLAGGLWAGRSQIRGNIPGGSAPTPTEAASR